MEGNTLIPKRVISAALYDKLEASAKEHGGVGSGDFLSYHNDCPLCIHGHAGVTEFTARTGVVEEIVAPATTERLGQNEELYALGIDWRFNDELVRANTSKVVGVYDARIPWDRYVELTGLTRGE